MCRSAILLLLGLLAAPVTAQEALVVAGLGGQAPLSRDDGSGGLSGLEPELAAALCARLEGDCTMTVAASWQDLIGGLREGRSALGFGGLSRLTLEGLGIAASTPYLPLLGQWAVIGEAGDPLAEDGPGIGVIRGTPHALWLEAHLPQERLVRFADDEEMFLSLHNGSVGALFGDGLVLWRDLLQAPLGRDVALRGPGVDVEADGLVLALSSDRDLALAVETALAEMAADGTLAALVARHLPGLPPP